MKATLAFCFLTASLLCAQPPGGGRGGSPVINQASQLDLDGKGTEARALFQKAIDEAATPAAKANAERAMAMSWAFEGNCAKTGEYEQRVIDYWRTQETENPGNAFYQEGEMADEAARVCIDAGDLDAAATWYKKGRDMGLKEPDISADRKALWEYRYEHALARLAARRGNKAEAEKHIALAKAQLEKMTDLRAQQESFFPYLTGYVAFYLGDYKTALTDFEKANQNDAFIQCLMGETYEKLGDKAKAMEYYRKAEAVRGHNPPAAFAKPLARKKLAGMAGMPAVNGQPAELATMRYIDVEAGAGAIAGPGQQYTVHYTGWLRDGTQFDSSTGKDPLQFVQGRRQVIAGWEMGFEGMKVGGKRRLFIPYQLAYGEKGRGPIPPKAELIFDVELLAVKDAPEIAAAADLVFPLNETQSKLTMLAKAVPADKYDWRPAPGVRSFKEVFIHVAYGTRMMMNAADGAAIEALRKEIESNSKAEQESMTKEQVVAALSENLDAYRKALETARAGSLSRDVDFFGTATTRRAVLADIDTHIAEHLGQLIAYARLNGIVPPWSK